MILSAAPAIFEAEYATSETPRWVARDGPSARGARADRAAGGRENTVRPRSWPSARARTLHWDADGAHSALANNADATARASAQASTRACAPDGCHGDPPPCPPVSLCRHRAPSLEGYSGATPQSHNGERLERRLSTSPIGPHQARSATPHWLRGSSAASA